MNSLLGSNQENLLRQHEMMIPSQVTSTFSSSCSPSSSLSIASLSPSSSTSVSSSCSFSSPGLLLQVTSPSNHVNHQEPLLPLMSDSSSGLSLTHPYFNHHQSHHNYLPAPPRVSSPRDTLSPSSPSSSSSSPSSSLSSASVTDLLQLHQHLNSTESTCMTYYLTESFERDLQSVTESSLHLPGLLVSPAASSTSSLSLTDNNNNNNIGTSFDSNTDNNNNNMSMSFTLNGTASSGGSGSEGESMVGDENTFRSHVMSNTSSRSFESSVIENFVSSEQQDLG